MASAEAAAYFHKKFQAGLQAFNEALHLATPDVTRASSELKALKGELSSALPTLPPYDQRSHDLKVRELETRLLAIRPKESKPRFAFGAKARQATQHGSPDQGSKANQDQMEPLQAASSTVTAAGGSGPAAAPEPTIYALSDCKGASLTLSDLPNPTGEHSSSLTVLLKDLEDCTVDLRPAAGVSARVKAIHAEGLSRTLVIAPIMDGACMLSHLEGCLVAVGSQQFRIHDSKDTTVLLHVPSVPIMEHSSGLRFGSYPFEPDNTQNRTNRFAQVQDFDWVREGPSPNWKLLDPQSQATVSGLLLKTSAKSFDADVRSQMLAVLQAETRD